MKRLREIRHRLRNAVRILRGLGVVPDRDPDMIWYTEPKLRVVSSVVPKVPPGTRIERVDGCWAVLGKSGEILTTGRTLEQVAKDAWEVYKEFDHGPDCA